MVRRPLALVLIGVMVLSALLVGCRRSAVPPIDELQEEEEPITSFEVAPEVEETETPDALEETTPPDEATPEPTEVIVETEQPEPVVTEPPEAETPTEPEVIETVEAVTEAPTPVVTGGASSYVVQPGDNLFRIALRHNVSLQALAQANNITNPSVILVGQTLTIPPSDGTTPTQPPLPAGCTNVYVVKPGDNLFRIGLRYNYSQYFLAQYNSIPNPSVLAVGQQICIP